jgi:uncharacterized protein YjbI with pentapeptide repeats
VAPHPRGLSVLPAGVDGQGVAHRPLVPIATGKIVMGAVVVAVITAAAVVVLWWAGTRGLQGAELVAQRLDALKVGLSIAVGSGGLFALYLGWRRQRSTEADLDNRERALAHQKQVAAATEARQDRVDADARLDAVERRITELYTKAVDQLGSDKSAVRLGGLYALERLAQDNPGQRQTIVNVLCAYLRMPYTPRRIGGQQRPLGVARPLLRTTQPTAGARPTMLTSADRDSAAAQEREVRLAAQRILAEHLSVLQVPGSDGSGPTPDSHWADIDIDLTGATLIDFDFSNCYTNNATFNHATFTGDTWFGEARFSGVAEFRAAQFSDVAWFRRARFNSLVNFNEAQFNNHAYFSKARFKLTAEFSEAQFSDFTEFSKARFCSLTDFSKTRFNSEAKFSRARFSGKVWFWKARFSGEAKFSGARFSSIADFRAAQFSGDTKFVGAQFDGSIDFSAAELPVTRYLGGSTPSPWTDFAKTRFARKVPAALAPFVTAPDCAAEENLASSTPTEVTSKLPSTAPPIAGCEFGCERATTDASDASIRSS